MQDFTKKPTRAKSIEEIEPLIELCKAGNLFEVQKWIKKGNPINPPEAKKGPTRKIPLKYVIERGFFSLVQVLLEGGSNVIENNYNALDHAVKRKRLDIIQLLVKHGANIHSIDMDNVFETWNPKIVSYFIDQGADIVSNYALAKAMCDKIRITIGIYKKYQNIIPGINEQANIALRFHCYRGNLKYTSLLLWAGADPWSDGMDDPYREPDLELNSFSLELAAMQNNLEIFKMKKINLDPCHPKAFRLLKASCSALVHDSTLLKMLLIKGFRPIDPKKQDYSLIQNIIEDFAFIYAYETINYNIKPKYIESFSIDKKLEMIRILFEYGVKWNPKNEDEIKQIRKSLLKISPRQIFDLVKILSENTECRKEFFIELIRTYTIQNHIGKHYLTRINKLIYF